MSETDNNTSSSSNGEIEVTSYEELREHFRYHWNEGRLFVKEVERQSEEAGKYMNGMVMILHEKNPDWSIKKIVYQICSENEDLDGFSWRNIYNYLDENNQALLKHTSPKKQNIVIEEESADLHSIVPEQSSIGGPLVTDTPEAKSHSTIGATQEDIDAINKMMKEEEEEETTPTKVEPSLDEKMTILSHENFKLEEQLKEARIKIKELETELKEANDTILKLQKELDTTQQLLREERAKNAELNKQLHELERYKRLEQIRLEAQRKSLESWKVPGDRPT